MSLQDIRETKCGHVIISSTWYLQKNYTCMKNIQLKLLKSEIFRSLNFFFNEIVIISLPYVENFRVKLYQ